MEIITLAHTLHTYWNRIDELKSFVIRDVGNILSIIDKVNYDSAIRALRDAQISRDPDSHIRSAITNLRTSLVAAEERITGANWFEKNLLDYFDPHESAYRSALTLSGCYRSLRDTRPEISYLKEARRHIEWMYGHLEVTGTKSENPKTDPHRRREIKAFANIYATSTGETISPVTPVFVIGGVSYIDGGGYCTACRKPFSIQDGVHTAKTHPLSNSISYPPKLNDCVNVSCLHCPYCDKHLRTIQHTEYNPRYL